MNCQLSYAFTSFYNTYKLLSTKVTSDNFNEYSIPYAVNGAFACELALKYILNSEKIGYSKTHLLHELFNLLPPNKKIAIIEDMKFDFPSLTDEEIKTVIFLISNTFEDLRYFYENNTCFSVNYAVSFLILFLSRHFFTLFMSLLKLNQIRNLSSVSVN